MGKMICYLMVMAYLYFEVIILRTIILYMIQMLLLSLMILLMKNNV